MADLGAWAMRCSEEQRKYESRKRPLTRGFRRNRRDRRDLAGDTVGGRARELGSVAAALPPL